MHQLLHKAFYSYRHRK